ncbi:hypothetical protein KKB18_11530 [bacterium]|nr:hypothetical protein [bacterium]
MKRKLKMNPLFLFLLVIMFSCLVFQNSVYSLEEEKPAEEIQLNKGQPAEVITPSTTNIEISGIVPSLISKVQDKPNDEGKAIEIFWEDKSPEQNKITAYEIFRGEKKDDSFKFITKLPPGTFNYTDGVNENNKDYFYIVRTITKNGNIDSLVSEGVKASGQWFDKNYLSVLLMTIFFVSVCIYFIVTSMRGKDYYIRPISGIAAVDEAIGRATEMGKPILFINGLGTASEPSTLASFAILGRVAKKAAEYKIRLINPHYEPIVMSVAQEVVKNSFIEAGHPDAYDEKDIFYITYDQFSFVAAVNGIMLRDKPATNFYMGMFYAESLILAETGSYAGSIQIAGTDQILQIPFFVTACDYTLIGEELYAASAYLSREPKLLGTLKGQDLGKLVAAAILVIGVITVTIGHWLNIPWLESFRNFFNTGN